MVVTSDGLEIIGCVVTGWKVIFVECIRVSSVVIGILLIVGVIATSVAAGVCGCVIPVYDVSRVNSIVCSVELLCELLDLVAMVMIIESDVGSSSVLT